MASASVRSLSALKASKNRSSASLRPIDCRATSDQLISGCSSISAFLASGTERVRLTVDIGTSVPYLYVMNGLYEHG